MHLLFWLSLGAIAWSILGYPLLLLAWAGLGDAMGALRFVGGGPDRRAGAAPWPRLSIVFPACDEEAYIRRKVENCLALDYPADRLEILIGCDGCTDRTAQVAREAGAGRVTVHELFPRAGKAAVLSQLVPLARGDVVVLTGAKALLEAGALKALARRFRDGAIGAVVGRLRRHDPAKEGAQETIFERYETTIRYLEGKRGCALGADGSLYALRRLLFDPLPADTVADDFVIPARVAARGWRVTFEPDAVAREEVSEDARRDLGRRARVVAGNWQSLARVPGILDPRTGFLFLAFVSHKLLRWAMPLLLAVALASCTALALREGAWVSRAALSAQLALYALAALGRDAQRLGGRLRELAAAAHQFVAMNVALAVGLWRFLRPSTSARFAGQRLDERTVNPAARLA